MHLSNAWLPAPVAEEARKEAEAFRSVVRSVRESWKRNDPDSVQETLKWISVVDLFLNAKSDISSEDVKELIEFGFEFFHSSQDMQAQASWGHLLNRLLKKNRKKNLSLSINWRPFYDTLMQMHFKRNTGPEGWRLRGRHLQVMTTLIKRCRKFFPAGSSSEIWTELNGFLINPWSHSAFEGAVFLSLFLTMNQENQHFFSSEWIEKCFGIWESVPNCEYWNMQWLSIFARSIKHCELIEWRIFLPRLFTHFLNNFQVSPSYGLKSEQFLIRRPQTLRSLFDRYGSNSNSIAKSIVYLLKHSTETQQYFQTFVDKLEQFFHPSNGGHWTYSLDFFFWRLVILFEKHLSFQTSNNKKEGIKEENTSSMGKLARETFCKTVLRLMDRGQYSKYEGLSDTVLKAISILSYVEPSLVLPFISSRFHLALQTTTATHQLRIAISSVASAGRAFVLFSNSKDSEGLIAKFLSFALLALDANDPPKTIAAMELICSIFSSISVEMIWLSEWLDEFFSRLFLLLRNIESNDIVHDGLKLASAKPTFLSEDNSYYSLMLQIILGKLSPPLFKQAMDKISHFVIQNFLPGITNEIGKLCSACVGTDSQLAGPHLINKIIKTTISSLKEISVENHNNEMISQSLEMVTGYHLRILLSAICRAGDVLINYQNELKEILSLTFKAPSWKINQAGGTVLLFLLRSLIFYYPVEQYKSLAKISSVDQWISTKGYKNGETESETEYSVPKWHIPNNSEVLFANELLEIHLKLASDDLVTTCQDKILSNSGAEKDYIKVTLLRIKCCLNGILSCLPDFKNNEKCNYFSIAGSLGATVGSSHLRERISQQMHSTCQYLLKERVDDSILLELSINIMDTLANFGSKEYEEYCGKDRRVLNADSLMEPPFNFIHSSHSQGHKRPRWVLVERSYMNNIWRASQSSYHKFRIEKNIIPSEYIAHLMQDLLTLSLHNYKGVRFLAVKTVCRILKRYPSLISNCMVILAEKLRNKKTEEHEVLGSCKLLSSNILLRHLNTDGVVFSSFIIGLLESFHHESLKSQEAITGLFVEFNKNYAGIPVGWSKNSVDQIQINCAKLDEIQINCSKSDDQIQINCSKSAYQIQINCSKFSDLVSKIRLLNFSSTTLKWRYSLMADRILLLLTLPYKNNNSNFPLNLHAETTGHFSKNLKSQLPQSRMLSISALNSLLTSQNNPSTKQTLSRILLQENQETLKDIFTELSFLHEDSESDDSSNHKSLFLTQSSTNEEITLFFYDFCASWPRTPNWAFLDSFPNNTSFNPRLARVFKRLIQECGTDILDIFQNMIEKFSCEDERSKRSVASEALAGLLHSNIIRSNNKWVDERINYILNESSFESINEWADCILYAVTGKGKDGNEIPLLRKNILECLVRREKGIKAGFVAKRYFFILIAFNEISPAGMSSDEVGLHEEILEELIGDVNHLSPQVREVVGATLCVVSSNLRYFAFSNKNDQSDKVASLLNLILKFVNSKEYTDNINQTETMFHFMISCLDSGKSSFLLDMVVSLIYPVLSLQDTTNKELAKLATKAFEALSWRIFPRPFLESAIEIILSSLSDSNWRIRYASLTYLEAFMFRHTFTLQESEKSRIWDGIKKLLSDNQVEVREHATKVLASLMKAGETEFSKTFREESYSTAALIINTKNHRLINRSTLASRHGVLLALAASVLSVPYDMPSWLPNHVTLLAKFITEPYPINITVTKTVAEFRRSHADTWDIQKSSFTEDQLEVLADTSLSSSYFA
ncbi:hypothetical protein LUZ60_003291 [Juncus effusus]|nr:hypothetical protein LUZ60_003291 [Juncus effusus]